MTKLPPSSVSLKDTLKLVIWDLDNTLWSGTLTEGDKLALREGVRDMITVLDEKGVLLSIASRNRHEDAMNQLEEFGLVDLFLVPEINWGPKSASITRILERLGISPEATVFIDDNPFERDEVRHHFPELATLDAQEMYELRHLAPQDTSPLSAQRRAMYQAEQARANAEAHFEGPEEAFLELLGMSLIIRPACCEDLDRAAELTDRTNQLNATGRRYSVAELEQRIKEDPNSVLLAELTDRYGDYGIIGLCVLERRQETSEIKLVLLSCRVLSRGISTVFINEIVEHEKALGQQVRAELIRTGRNRLMELAFRFAGFKTLDTKDDLLRLTHTPDTPWQKPGYVAVTLRGL
jgi:FkbH-like protein